MNFDDQHDNTRTESMQEKMTLFENVPVVDVHRENLQNLWPSILFACKSSTFIALDAELSGLGPRKKLTAKSMDDRYAGLCNIAQTRAILSIGISCFAYKKTDENQKCRKFGVQTFNITTLCSEDYTVEPDALKFLVDHGFDFNKQYAKGVPYHRGRDLENELNTVSIRNLFAALILYQKPIILHNGLVDLVFFYHNLYTELPPSFQHFVSDLSEMFAGGLYDTKYIAEFHAKLSGSYLEYVFRKSHQDNFKRSQRDESHVALEFLQYSGKGDFVGNHPCPLPHGIDSTQDIVMSDLPKICEFYSVHGFCPKQKTCVDSHNIDLILQVQNLEEERKERQRKRKAEKRKRKRQQRQEKLEGKNDESIGREKRLKLENNEGGETKEETDDLQIQNGHGDTQDESMLNDGAVKECINVPVAEEGRKNSHNEQIDISERFTKNDGDLALKQENQVHDGKLDQKQENMESSIINSFNLKLKSTCDLGMSENETKSTTNKLGNHRAGFDAFMTGFSMAYFILVLGNLEEQDEVGHFGMRDVVNKLYLGGKNIPLLVAKSAFSKNSVNHVKKLKSIRMEGR